MMKAAAATAAVILAMIGYFLFVAPAPAADLGKMQAQMLSPTVQLDQNCSGSVIWSKRDEKTGKVETLILTAKHCVADASSREYMVRVPVYQNNVITKHESFVGTVKGQSYKVDLALIVLRDTTTLFEKTAKLAPADVALMMGEDVWTVGYPLGLAMTITPGLFGSVETIDYPTDGSQFYRATPNAAPGNSGGALYHATGAGDFELIGVTAMQSVRFFYVTFYTRAADIHEYLKVAAPYVVGQAPAAAVVSPAGK